LNPDLAKLPTHTRRFDPIIRKKSFGGFSFGFRRIGAIVRSTSALEPERLRASSRNRFREVIAIEPDPLMVEKLREAAPQATIIQTTAEEYEREQSSADLINFAQSLHWMEIPRVLEKCSGWLRTSGILAVYGFGLPEAVEPVREIVRLELREHWGAYRDERLRRKHFPQCLVDEQTGLRVVEDVELSHSCKMTAAEFAGFWRSTSYGGAYGRALDDPEVYWQDLESRFRAAWKEDKIPVDFKPYLLIARKEQ
jgi:hypothetical protein